MGKSSSNVHRLHPARARPGGAAQVVGRLAAVLDDGRVLVDFRGNPGEPLPARLATALSRDELTAGAPLLLLFDDAEPARPIVVGLLRERVAPAPAGARELRVDGERLVFEAQREVVLRCGQGSITLTADGRIVIKGRELVSRAAGSNKIRGATVLIN